MPVLFDARTPTWEALRLGRHLTSLKVALIPYFAGLLLFWLHVFDVHRLERLQLDIVGWLLALTYLFLVAETFYIQKVMHDSSVYKHGAWQVIAGALCLNPCVFGWWMPLSVLWVAARVRRQLEALHLARLSEIFGESSPESLEPRRAGPVWKLPPRVVIWAVAVGLPLLFLLWHFANIQKAR